MNKREVWERAKQVSPLPKNIRGCRGHFWNADQFRLEHRENGGELVCWVSLEALQHMGSLPDAMRQDLIRNAQYWMAQMLADFFYPGWQLAHYMKTGRRVSL